MFQSQQSNICFNSSLSNVDFDACFLFEVTVNRTRYQCVYWWIDERRFSSLLILTICEIQTVLKSNKKLFSSVASTTAKRWWSFSSASAATPTPWTRRNGHHWSEPLFCQSSFNSLGKTCCESFQRARFLELCMPAFRIFYFSWQQQTFTESSFIFNILKLVFGKLHLISFLSLQSGQSWKMLFKFKMLKA